MSDMDKMPGHKYWVHYIAYIGEEQQGFEGGIGTVRKTPLEDDFVNVEAAQVEIVQIVRQKSNIPQAVPVAVTILGWNKMASGLIARVH